MPPFVREILIGNIINERLCLTCTNKNLLLLQQINNEIETSNNDAILNEQFDVDEGRSFQKCVILKKVVHIQYERYKSICLDINI